MAAFSVSITSLRSTCAALCPLGRTIGLICACPACRPQRDAMELVESIRTSPIGAQATSVPSGVPCGTESGAAAVVDAQKRTGKGAFHTPRRSRGFPSRRRNRVPTVQASPSPSVAEAPQSRCPVETRKAVSRPRRALPRRCRLPRQRFPAGPRPAPRGPTAGDGTGPRPASRVPCGRGNPRPATSSGRQWGASPARGAG